MTLGEQIKAQRKKAGLTQEKMAEKLGVSRQAVTKWESDQAAPSADKLIALATLFNISFDDKVAFKVVEKTLGEQIKEQRKKAGLTQEKLAEKLGVSRQAVTKWEADQAAPSADKLIALATVFNISIDDMMALKATGKKRNNIFSLAAIIVQLAALSSCTYVTYSEVDGTQFLDTTVLYCKLIVLLSASIWMAINLFREKDKQRRAQNMRYELVYCCIQVFIVLMSQIFKIAGIGALVILLVCMTYIFVVNPKFMGRTLVEKATMQKTESYN